MVVFWSILEIFIVLWATYLIVTLSVLISEKSGVTNIGINGVMVMGAMSYAIIMSSDSITSALGFFSPFFALIVAGLVGLGINYIYGITVVTFQADQIIAGTAINLIAAAASVLTIELVYSQDFLSWQQASPIPQMHVNLIYIMFLLIAFIILGIVWYILKYTVFGLHIKASGENPYALEASSISVNSVRYKVLLISGALAGIAGGIVMPAFSNTFNGTVNGIGYIAIAILIFSQWKVSWSVLGTFLISSTMAIATYWTLFDINFPAEIINMIPFILPIVILVFIKKSNAPKYLGKSFKKDERQ